MHSTHSEATAITAVFKLLDRYLFNPVPCDEYIATLDVGHIVTTLTGCVQVFSRLEEKLDGHKTNDGLDFNAWDRARLAMKEFDTRQLMANLLS
jgi:hypothetical protein